MSLELSPGFFLLIAWFAAVNGWQLLLEVLGAAFLHELGHGLALRLQGTRVRRLRVGLLGAEMEIDRVLSYSGELAVLLAGPLTNVLSALGLLALDTTLASAAGAHIVLGLFNLLPIRPLDGGRALELAVSWLLGPTAGERAARWLSAWTALGMACFLGWLMWRSGGSLWLLPAAVVSLSQALREISAPYAYKKTPLP